MKYLFPTDEVERGTNIAIYGFGKVGKDVAEFIKKTNYCNLVFIIDANPKMTESVTEIPVINICELSNELISSIDKIVVTVKDEDMQQEIYELLINKSVNEDKIVVVNYDEYEQVTLMRKYERQQEILGYMNHYMAGVSQFVSKKGRINEFQLYRDLFLTAENTRLNNQKDISRLIFLWTNLEMVLEESDGEIAELGVFQGSTAAVFARIAQKYERKLYLFDTFEGFCKNDLVGVDGKVPELFKDTTMDRVVNFVGKSHNIHYVKGYFPESVSDAHVENVYYSFVHIDCDLYKPIGAGLDYFSKHLADNGMIVVHDYYSGYWDGAKKAVDEFLNKNRKYRKILIPDLSGSVAILKSSI